MFRSGAAGPGPYRAFIINLLLRTRHRSRCRLRWNSAPAGPAMGSKAGILRLSALRLLGRIDILRSGLPCIVQGRGSRIDIGNITRLMGHP